MQKENYKREVDPKAAAIILRGLTWVTQGAGDNNPKIKSLIKTRKTDIELLLYKMTRMGADDLDRAYRTIECIQAVIVDLNQQLKFECFI